MTTATTTTRCLTDHHAEFADGTYRFWLRMRELSSFEAGEETLLAFYWKLSQATGIDASGTFIYTATGGPAAHRIVELIRLALIGGNHATLLTGEAEVAPEQARRLVEQYCYPARPIEEAAALAFNIAHAAVYGNAAHREVEAKPEAG